MPNRVVVRSTLTDLQSLRVARARIGCNGVDWAGGVTVVADPSILADLAAVDCDVQVAEPAR